ncbi:MAG: hypothetical protein LBK98_04270 [Peptococcaceae bacterium]|jgi:hypothetical protein|nr:hypothetical protein [Peptococcaceae bacterium]
MKVNRKGFWRRLELFLAFLAVFGAAAGFYFIRYETTEPAFYYFRAAVYERLGQEEKSRSDYRRALWLEYDSLGPERAEIVVSRPFQERRQGVTLMRLCREIDQETLLPVGEADSFSYSEQRIYCLVHLARPMAAGESLVMEWYYLGNDPELPIRELRFRAADEAPGYNVYDFSLSRADWQNRPGAWEAVFYLGDNDGFITHSEQFTIQQS